MTQTQIEKFIADLENVEREENMGYIFFFVGSNHMVPFTTIAEEGNQYESVSKLDRKGVFRVNIGVSPKTFNSLFPNVNLEEIDFSVIDTFLPHPHYSSQFFICILNPSEKNDEEVKKFILEAHSLAKKRFELRKTGS